MPLTVHIITPERSWEPMVADSVTLPAFDGEVGILTKHAPFVCELGEGKLALRSDSSANHTLACKGGVAQVQDDEIRILAESVVDSDEVTEGDLAARLKALDEAEYATAAEKVQAEAEAHWIVTQLKSAGNEVPALKQLHV